MDAFLAKSCLEPYETYRRGGIRRRAEIHHYSGLKLRLSEAERLSEEAVDVVKFLSAHFDELQRLQRFPGVTDLHLDFGYYRREVVAQFDCLPVELIKLAGGLGMSIELSLYTVSSSEIETD